MDWRQTPVINLMTLTFLSSQRLKCLLFWRNQELPNQHLCCSVLAIWTISAQNSILAKHQSWVTFSHMKAWHQCWNWNPGNCQCWLGDIGPTSVCYNTCERQTVPSADEPLTCQPKYLNDCQLPNNGLQTDTHKHTLVLHSVERRRTNNPPFAHDCIPAVTGTHLFFLQSSRHNSLNFLCQSQS